MVSDMEFKKGDPIRYVAMSHDLRLHQCKGEFDRYTNKARTRCRYFLNINGTLKGFTGPVDDIRAYK